MLDIFVSPMYCSHLSIKPTQFLLGEKDESEETWYNQSTTHKTIFRCWDSNYIWVKNSENARNFCNHYALSSPRLNFIIHKVLAVFITFFNLLKAFDSSDIHFVKTQYRMAMKSRRRIAIISKNEYEKSIFLSILEKFKKFVPP